MRITKEILQKQIELLQAENHTLLIANNHLRDTLEIIEKYTQPFYEKTIGQSTAIQALTKAIETLIIRR